MKNALDLLETVCVIAALVSVGLSLFIGLRHPHPKVANVEGAVLAAAYCFALLSYILKPRGRR